MQCYCSSDGTALKCSVDDVLDGCLCNRIKNRHYSIYTLIPQCIVMSAREALPLKYGQSCQ